MNLKGQPAWCHEKVGCVNGALIGRTRSLRSANEAILMHSPYQIVRELRGASKSNAREVEPLTQLEIVL